MSPTIILFAAVSFGSYVGIFYDLPTKILFIAALGCCLTALLIRNLILQASMVIGFAFLISCVGARSYMKQFDASVAEIPEKYAVLEGQISNISKNLKGEVRGLLEVTGVIADQQRKVASFNVWISLKRDAAKVHLLDQDTVRVYAQVRTLIHALSVGVFDSYLFGIARNVHASVAVSDKNLISVVRNQKDSKDNEDLKGNWISFSQQRTNFAEKLLSLTQPRKAAVILALTVGDTSLFESEQREIYRSIGASHLLAVSGLQVSLIAMLLFKFLQIIFLFVPRVGRLSRANRCAALLTLILIWCYVALCGAPPSVVRAAIMASSLLVGTIIAHPVSLIDSLGIAGLATVLISPSSVIDPSFLLSYAAVIGLFVASSLQESPLIESDVIVEEPRDIRKKWLYALVIASLCASLITMPLSSHLFGELSPASLVANILLVPIASILQVPAIFLSLFGVLFENSSMISGAAFCCGILEALCDGLNQLIGGKFLVSSPNIVITLIITLSIGCSIILIAHKRIVLSASAIILACGILMVPKYFEPDGLKITALAVGQGDATVFQFPSGHTMLVDGGGVHDESFDPGKDIVLPFLWREGVKKLDVMVVSHPDLDHILGLISVLETMPVKSIWHSGFGDDNPLMARLLARAREKNIPILVSKDLWGTHQFGSSIVEVLAPHAEVDEQLYAELGTNDNSLVIRVHHNDYKALWPGDIEEWGEYLLLESKVDVQADVVKAPHHGSKTSSTQAFVDATQAQQVIFCTKEKNQWGFPHSQVVKRWHNSGARIWDTGRHGETTFWFSKKGIVVKPFRSPLPPLIKGN